MKRALNTVVTGIILLSFAIPAAAGPLDDYVARDNRGNYATAETAITNEQIRALIIQASRNAYYATGHPCACPDDRARNGTKCGGPERV